MEKNLSMTFQVDQGNARRRLPGWLDLLRTIWVDAVLIFVRKFNYLHKEIRFATWGRFFLTIITTLFVGSGLYQLAIGLSIEGIYEKTLRLPFNLFGYWWVQTLWAVVTLAIINIPIILLAAYLSFNWFSRTKQENTYWLQEAQMLVITWTITFLLIQAVRLLGGVVTDAFYRSTTNFLTRASVEHRYTPITSYIFSGLLTAPIIARKFDCGYVKEMARTTA